MLIRRVLGGAPMRGEGEGEREESEEKEGSVK